MKRTGSDSPLVTWTVREWRLVNGLLRMGRQVSEGNAPPRCPPVSLWLKLLVYLRASMSPSSPSRNECHRALRAHHQHPALRISASRIEPNPHLLLPVDPSWIIRRPEIKRKILSHDKNPLWRNRPHARLLLAHTLAHGRLVHSSVISHR